MKKLISILLAAIMATSLCAASAIPVMAVPSRVAPVLEDDKATTTVNGKQVPGVIYNPSETNPNEVTFVYTGEGTLVGWEHNLISNGLVEGVDFNAVQNPDGSFTITFVTEKAVGVWNAGLVVVNALVDFPTTEPDEDTTEKKNTSSKSPATGVSTVAIAGSIAAAGAGIAVLAATKKKDAE